MARYIVEVREVHVSHRVIESATNTLDAIELVQGGEGEEIYCEYSHTLRSDTWRVYEVDTENNEIIKNNF